MTDNLMQYCQADLELQGRLREKIYPEHYSEGIISSMKHKLAKFMFICILFLMVENLFGFCFLGYTGHWFGTVFCAAQFIILAYYNSLIAEHINDTRK